MTNPAAHISICICTYKRPQLLERLLESLSQQQAEEAFHLSIVVADNDRPEHPTGTALSWRDARTGNVLLRRSALEGLGSPFRAEFGSGSEDQDFFRRLGQKGRKFVWCKEAIVYETVPAGRWRRGFMLK